MDVLLHQSATKMAEAIRCKDISAVELLTAVVAAIEKYNPSINAVVQLDTERAMQQAQRMDDMLAKGLLLGPFHGVPFTVKDVYNTEGIITSLGTLGLREHVPTHDATLIQRLKTAGGILVGKTNVPELCTAAETTNLVYGTTNNPYDLKRTPGGSSGGEAAIIATGASPFGIGSDLGGSLRIPAHYCGIATIRPTIGRVACALDIKGNSQYGIRTAAEARLAVDGPMSRHVEDLLPLLGLISGSDGIDPHAEDVPLRNSHDIDIEQLNIGYFLDNGVVTPNLDITHSIQNAVNSLTDNGVKITEAQPTFMHEVAEVIVQLFAATQAAQTLEAALLAFNTKQPSDLLHKYLDRLRREASQHHDLNFAWAAWDYYRSNVVQYMHPYDAIVCPVLPFTALKHDESIWDDAHYPALSYCLGFSLHKCPIATVRVGEDKHGLPIGVQIVTKPWREDIAIAVAKRLEDNCGGWKSPYNQ